MAVGGLVVMVTLRVLSPDGVGSGGPGAFVALVAGVATAAAVILVSVRWSLAAVSVALEDAGPRRSLVRSWHLTGGHTWRTLAVLVVIGILTSLLATVVAQVLDVVLVDGLASTDRLRRAWWRRWWAPSPPCWSRRPHRSSRPSSTTTCGCAWTTGTCRCRRADAPRLGAEEQVEPAP